MASDQNQDSKKNIFSNIPDPPEMKRSPSFDPKQNEITDQPNKNIINNRNDMPSLLSPNQMFQKINETRKENTFPNFPPPPFPQEANQKNEFINSQKSLKDNALQSPNNFNLIQENKDRNQTSNIINNPKTNQKDTKPMEEIKSNSSNPFLNKTNPFSTSEQFVANKISNVFEEEKKGEKLGEKKEIDKRNVLFPNIIQDPSNQINNLKTKEEKKKY